MMLELRNVVAGYDEKNPILKGLNLTIAEGEVVGIIGQNGSGKSTLAKAIMQMVPNISGDIYFDGIPLIGKTTAELSDLGIGYFLQGGRIFPHLTVEENLLFAGRKYTGSELNQNLNELKLYFKFLQNDKMHLQASALSGGEQHQLALAMILIQKPKFLILDEPSAGLSPSNAEFFFNLIVQLKLQFISNILIIEHNHNALFSICKRIGKFSSGSLQIADTSQIKSGSILINNKE